MDKVVRAILNELERHVYTRAHLTLLTSRGEASKWRLRKYNGYLQFENKHDTEFFSDVVIDSLHDGFLIMVLRSLTSMKRNGKYIKELRAYRITRKGGLVISKVPIDELIVSMNMNSLTGELLEPEPAVMYCIDDECISSEDIKEEDLQVYIRNIRKWMH
ncbi:MAG: hypothetical protein RXR16_03820 [Thermocladium sp.]